MRRRRLEIGFGAATLLVLFAVMMLGVFGALSFLDARDDLQLSRRMIEMEERLCALDEAAEFSMARLDGVLVRCAAACGGDEDAYLSMIVGELPISMELEGRLVVWTERAAGGQTLDCVAELMPFQHRSRAEWRSHRLAVDPTQMND